MVRMPRFVCCSAVMAAVLLQFVCYGCGRRNGGPDKSGPRAADRTVGGSNQKEHLQLKGARTTGNARPTVPPETPLEETFVAVAEFDRHDSGTLEMIGKCLSGRGIRYYCFGSRGFQVFVQRRDAENARAALRSNQESGTHELVLILGGGAYAISAAAAQDKGPTVEEERASAEGDASE